MSFETPADPRVASSGYAIGNPGRAGLELPAGAPPDRVGLSDVELSAATEPGMLVRAATVRGLLHRSNGEARQDAFALGRHAAEDGTAHAVAVVCDGVGSLGRSDEAAALVSRRLATLGAAAVPWPEAFTRVNEELQAFAKEPRNDDTGDPNRDGMATTAVALAVQREGDAWVGDVAWVGDSSLWHLDLDGRWTPLTGQTDEDVEGYHSTGVRPMPTPGGGCTTREVRVGAGALFLMSDGIANPLTWSGDVREALAEWWRRPPDPFTFAAQAAFARKSHVDDRTVVGLWPDVVSEESGDAV